MIMRRTKSEYHEFINSNTICLVLFYTEWCKPCIDIIPDLLKYEDVIPIIKVDIDEVPELVLEYNIRPIPYLMLFKSGIPQYSLYGVINESTIEELLRSIIT